MIRGRFYYRHTRQALTPEQINEACYVDINRNKAVFASLRNNPKPTHHLRGKEQLLSLIRKFPEGLSVADVKDAYPSVMEDLQALREAGLVRVLSNLEAKEDVVYPDDPKAAMEVDDALKQLFRSVELPVDMLDLERELQRSGIRPATDTAARRRAAGRGLPGAKFVRKREIRKRTKLTNVHLPELFRNLNLPRT
ncbi:unnamed protein product [Spirodela intermedia]|uniref:TFA2 Winged helix domain-containing protein n=1 Tax=Spirodela intermedia TaxID=51605 RepID=A0A7I8J3I1_SPIIN|nr:unnamed protein product [Spirodela intermedia]CAA6664679.1 unnamed protein product [Spirodela intermedia]